MEPPATPRGPRMNDLGFHYWTRYGGELLDDGDARHRSVVYGFQLGRGGAPDREELSSFVVPSTGACFGYVATGQAVKVRCRATASEWLVEPGEYFCTQNGAEVWVPDEGLLTKPTRIVTIQRLGWKGIPVQGGPIEPRGRLKYIDGCSDTLLIGPLKLGDPCLNHLHFPPRVVQTPHTHPSSRLGIVAGGSGVCVTDGLRLPLTPGMCFAIPTGCLHSFETEDSHLDVVAYHPDSDFGPTDEVHPMVNRTWVGGSKIDNTSGVHQSAEVQGTEVPFESVEAHPPRPSN